MSAPKHTRFVTVRLTPRQHTAITDLAAAWGIPAATACRLIIVRDLVERGRIAATTDTTETRIEDDNVGNR